MRYRLLTYFKIYLDIFYFFEGGEFFHEFEYEDWEEIDVTKPIPIWISFLLLISYLCLGNKYFIMLLLLLL